MLMIRRRNVYWETKLKNQVRKTWGVTYVLLIMEEVLSIKMLNLKNKSHFYHQGGGEEGEERSQHFGFHNKSSQSIFFGHAFKLCQRRLILPPFPFKTRRPPPPHPQDPLTLKPLFPSEKWWPIPYFWSALFREWKVYDFFPFPYNFSIFLIWDWRMLWILQIFPKSNAI